MYKAVLVVVCLTLKNNTDAAVALICEHILYKYHVINQCYKKKEVASKLDSCATEPKINYNLIAKR